MIFAPSLRPFLFAIAALVLTGTAPAYAQSYEGLMEEPIGSPLPGPASSSGGYSGLVGWDDNVSATNPYGTPPASDIYQFIQGSGATFDQRKEIARQEREAQKLLRQKQVQEQNIARAEKLQQQLKAIGEERQRKLLEQQQEIILKMQQRKQQGK